MRGVFLPTTKKTYVAIPGSSVNFVITDIIFYVFLSSFFFLHSMEKYHSFLFFSPFYRIYDIFLSSLYFQNLICMRCADFYFFTRRIHGIVEPL